MPLCLWVYCYIPCNMWWLDHWISKCIISDTHGGILYWISWKFIDLLRFQLTIYPILQPTTSLKASYQATNQPFTNPHVQLNNQPDNRPQPLVHPPNHSPNIPTASMHIPTNQQARQPAQPIDWPVSPPNDQPASPPTDQPTVRPTEKDASFISHYIVLGDIYRPMRYQPLSSRIHCANIWSPGERIMNSTSKAM